MTQPSQKIGQKQIQIKSFVSELKKRPNFPLNLARFSMVLWERQEIEEAQGLAWKAIQLAPYDTRVRFAVQGIVARQIPGWHWGLIRDDRRVQVYAKALSQLVQPGMHVLDIGTGTGILGLLAARAGAEQVTTCEKEPHIAKKAHDIIKQNGWDHKIRVINKHSRELKVGSDLPPQG